MEKDEGGCVLAIPQLSEKVSPRWHISKWSVCMIALVAISSLIGIMYIMPTLHQKASQHAWLNGYYQKRTMQEKEKLISFEPNVTQQGFFRVLVEILKAFYHEHRSTKEKDIEDPGANDFNLSRNLVKQDDSAGKDTPLRFSPQFMLLLLILGILFVLLVLYQT